MDQLFEGALFTEDVTGQEEDQLRNVFAYSPALGRVVIAADDGNIRSADLRQQLLSGEWNKERQIFRFHSNATPLTPRTLLPRPDLDLNVTHISLSRTGTFAAVSGPTLADPEITAIFIVDITARRPVAKSTATAAGVTSGDASSCDAIPLDPFLFSSRPGLRVLQLSWHPDSERHLAVLTSDACWRLYDVQRPDLAEQTFELQGNDRRRLELEDVIKTAAKPVAFAFSPVRDGWDRFAIYFTSSTGDVYVLCPVVPFGCQYPARVLDALDDAVASGVLGCQTETTEAWLRRAFQPLDIDTVGVFPAAASRKFNTDTNTSGAVIEAAAAVHIVTSVAHALDEHVPSLLGPLDTTTATGEPLPAGGVHALAPKDHQGRSSNSNNSNAQIEDLLIWRYGEGCTAVATASSSGIVGLFLLLGSASPQWQISRPQCVVQGGSLKAVRCQVEPNVAMSRYTRGGGEEEDETQQELLLLDIVVVGCSSTPSSSSPQTAGFNNNNNTLNGIGGGGQQLNTSTLDDDSDLEDLFSTMMITRRHALRLDPANPDIIYSVYSSGVSAVTVTWLPVLGESLANAQGPPPDLPSPIVQELVSNSTSVVDAVPVGDALCGSGVLILFADGSHTLVKASSSLVTGGGIEGGKTSSPFNTSQAAAGAPYGTEEIIDAQIQATYEHLLQGPDQPNNLQNPLPKGLTPDSIEGRTLLTESIAALRSTHVEFIHQAHLELEERLRQVQSELQSQQQRLERLQSVAETANARGSEVGSIFERVSALQTNLTSRLQLLAELHWALPRPASEEEMRFGSEELPALETAAGRLADDVKLLSNQAAVLQRDVSSSLKSSTTSVYEEQKSELPSIPLNQLRKARHALLEQERMIASLQRQTTACEEALSVGRGNGLAYI